MFTTISLFLKNKVFSTAGVFLLAFVVLIGAFIFYNSDTILEKFGFETTATLKSELAKSQKDLETAKQVNNELNITMTELQDRHAKDIKVLNEHTQDKEVVVQTVYVTKETLVKRSAPVKKRLEEKTVTTVDTITTPIQEYNELSTQNIQAIHSAFKSLQLQPTV